MNKVRVNRMDTDRGTRGREIQRTIDLKKYKKNQER